MTKPIEQPRPATAAELTKVSGGGVMTPVVSTPMPFPRPAGVPPVPKGKLWQQRYGFG
jgi:hypothetical protein